MPEQGHLLQVEVSPGKLTGSTASRSSTCERLDTINLRCALECLHERACGRPGASHASMATCSCISKRHADRNIAMQALSLIAPTTSNLQTEMSVGCTRHLQLPRCAHRCGERIPLLGPTLRVITQSSKRTKQTKSLRKSNVRYQLKSPKAATGTIAQPAGILPVLSLNADCNRSNP